MSCWYYRVFIVNGLQPHKVPVLIGEIDQLTNDYYYDHFHGIPALKPNIAPENGWLEY